jgi:mannose-6-phosphate isomerase
VSSPAISVLSNPIRPYDWGSRTALAELLGTESPSPGPQAELWMGAHSGDPSVLSDGTSLEARIAADPVGELGDRAVAAFGPRLPFLGKILAAARPLSLQVHPTLAQARAGFAAEDAAGVARDDPARNYKDDNHKPELICALTPFRGLAGFRPVERTARLFELLAVPALRPFTAALADGAAGLRRIVGDLLRLPAAECGPLVADVVAACRTAGPDFAAERQCASELNEAFPGDPGIVVALLLNLVELVPGQALFLPAGVPHAYLNGVGVEVMANSDNVLRGGLTSKHIDVAELLAILDTEPGAPHVQDGVPGSNGELVYPTAAREFVLSRISGGIRLPAGSPQIVVVTDGSLSLARDGEESDLARGRAAYLSAAGGPVEVGGAGTGYRITTDLDAPGVA